MSFSYYINIIVTPAKILILDKKKPGLRPGSLKLEFRLILGYIWV